MRWVCILPIVLLIAGCSGGGDQGYERVSPRYMLDDAKKEEALLHNLSTSQDPFYFDLGKKIRVKNSQNISLFFALKNNHSEHRCYYLQPVCDTTTATGGGCDIATFSRGSKVYWEWFDLPRKILVKANTSQAYKGSFSTNGAPGAYIGDIVVWSGESAGKSCPMPQSFSESRGLRKEHEKSIRLVIH